MKRKDRSARQPLERGPVDRASEQWFRRIFDSSHDAIFILDATGQILDANRVAEERYGYRREELLSMSARDLAPERLLGQVAERVQEAFGGGILQSTHRRADGSELPVEIGAARVELNGTQVILSTVRDVTQRKADERRIEGLLRT